jgi:glycosyltransferase involved in cell wall biosynthesis
MSGHIHLVSRSVPPHKSGSAHIVKEFLAADSEGLLQTTGAYDLLRLARPPAGPIRYVRTELNFAGRGARFFQWPRLLLFPLLVWRLYCSFRLTDCAHVLAIYPDDFYCRAAILAARGAGKPYSLYFHNTYAGNRSGLGRYVALASERRWLRHARRAYFISDALRDHYRRQYPEAGERISTLPHPIRIPPLPPTVWNPRPRLRAVMIGNINESNMEATRRLFAVLSARTDVEVVLSSPVPRALLQLRGIPLEGIDHRGYLPETELSDLLANADIFLLPHGFNGAYGAAEYATIFPTRAVTYLAHGKPILVHAPSDSFLSRFFADRACGLVVHQPTAEALNAAIDLLRQAPATALELGRRAREAAREFDSEHILRRLRAELQ